MDNRFLVPYYRVSTRHQRKSGLGLEAQRRAVRHFADLHKMRILKEFVEVDKRSNNNRPVLASALKYCKEHNAVLVVKSLDRLTNKVSFIATLMDSQDFIAVETPFALKFIIYMLVAVAELENELLSKRTTERKQDGFVTGGPKQAESCKPCQILYLYFSDYKGGKV